MTFLVIVYFAPGGVKVRFPSRLCLRNFREVVGELWGGVQKRLKIVVDEIKQPARLLVLTHTPERGSISLVFRSKHLLTNMSHEYERKNRAFVVVQHNKDKQDATLEASWHAFTNFRRGE